MNTVTVSPKFQVAIPDKIRKEMGIRVGQEGCLEFVPIRNFRSHCEPFYRFRKSSAAVQGAIVVAVGGGQSPGRGLA